MHLQALRVGLKALRLLGVKGVSCDVLWGLVETQPQTYNWGPYRTLFKLISDMGFQIKVWVGAGCRDPGTPHLRVAP